MSLQPSSEPPTNGARPPSSIRWRPAAIVLALMLLAVLSVFFLPGMWRGMQVVGTMATLTIGGALLMLWFVSISGFSKRTRLVVCGALGLIGLSLTRLVRIDSFDGDMLPILAWRSTPTAEEVFEKSRAKPAIAPAAIGEEPKTPQPPDAAAPLVRTYSGFLGDNRLAWIPDLKLQRDWNAHPPKELWRKPIGLGWSAFAIGRSTANPRMLAVTQEQRGQAECVVAYDLLTGHELWEHRDTARFSEALGGDGPRATPTIVSDRVYALGATGLLNCLDLFSGRKHWSVDILADNNASNLEWGMAGSPLVVDEAVIVSPGGREGRSLVAYHATTGSCLWRAGSDAAAYASPQLTTLAGVRQVLVCNGPGLSAHDPQSGKLLWTFPFAAEQTIKCAQPAVLHDFGYEAGRDQVLVSSGYAIGSFLLRVVREGDSLVAHRVWPEAVRKLRSKFANLLIRDGFVYGLDEGILTCLDLATGQQRWKGGRYGHGQMILVDDLLLIQVEAGDVALVEATPEAHREVARFVALSARTWNHAALAAPYLLVRNDREAACFELPLVLKEEPPSTAKP